jgi:hypothetical protein
MVVFHTDEDLGKRQETLHGNRPEEQASLGRHSLAMVRFDACTATREMDFVAFSTFERVKCLSEHLRSLPHVLCENLLWQK